MNFLLIFPASTLLYIKKVNVVFLAKSDKISHISSSMSLAIHNNSLFKHNHQILSFFFNIIIHYLKVFVKCFSKIFFVILHKFSFIKNLQSFQDLFINAEPQSLQKIFFLFTIYSHKVDRAHQKRSTQVNEFFVNIL